MEEEDKEMCGEIGEGREIVCHIEDLIFNVYGTPTEDDNKHLLEVEEKLRTGVLVTQAAVLIEEHTISDMISLMVDEYGLLDRNREADAEEWEKLVQEIKKAIPPLKR